MARISADERSKQFIEAAAKVIAYEGLDAATTRRIATEAGAPLAALHYVFKSKDELLEAVYDHLSSDFAAKLAPLDEGLGVQETVYRHIARIGERIIERPHEQITTFEILLRAARTDQDESKEKSGPSISQKMFDAWVTSTADVYSKALQRNGLTPTVSCEAAARMTVAGVDGMTLQYVSDFDAERMRQSLHQLATLIVYMLTEQTITADGS